jgi:hypothetical protein
VVCEGSTVTGSSEVQQPSCVRDGRRAAAAVGDDECAAALATAFVFVAAPAAVPPPPGAPSYAAHPSTVPACGAVAHKRRRLLWCRRRSHRCADAARRDGRACCLVAPASPLPPWRRPMRWDGRWERAHRRARTSCSCVHRVVRTRDSGSPALTVAGGYRTLAVGTVTGHTGWSAPPAAVEHLLLLLRHPLRLEVPSRGGRKAACARLRVELTPRRCGCC